MSPLVKEFSQQGAHLSFLSFLLAFLENWPKWIENWLTSVCIGVPSCRSSCFPFSGLTQPQPKAVEPLCPVLCQSSDRWLTPQEVSYSPANSAVYSWANMGNKTRGSWGMCLNERAMLGSFSPAVCRMAGPLYARVLPSATLKFYS